MGVFRLVALDLDGTTIDRELVVRPRVREAIGAVAAAGVHVSLATGRMVRTTRPFAAELDLATPLICYQGAHVEAADGTVLYSNPTEAEAAAEITALALERGLYIQAYINDELWIAEERPELDEYRSYATVPLPVNVEPDLVAMLRETAPTKLLWIADPDLLVPLLEQWSSQFKGRLSIFRSHDRFGEAASPTSSKGVALAHLAESLHIPREQVLAIGDRQNDAPMLEWAGLGLAMGNADEYARAAADEIIPPFAEDGVAYALERWILEAQ